jgi:L-fuconolactonase
MYGSNWPVSGRYASYATVYGIVAEYFRNKGAAAAPKFFSGNARSAYQWAKR